MQASEKSVDVWLCPECEAEPVPYLKCKICDGLGFITDMEMRLLETRARPHVKLTHTHESKSEHVLILDLSEFEQEEAGEVQ